MKNYRQRINTIIGQLDGVGKMIDDEKDYFEVLVQIKAARSALDSVLHKFTEEKLLECMNMDSKEGEACSRFIKEIIKST